MSSIEAQQSAEPVEVDPRMVLAAIERGSELGAALVREGHLRVLAEHYAAEAGRLRDQLAAATSNGTQGAEGDGAA